MKDSEEFKRHSYTTDLSDAFSPDQSTENQPKKTILESLAPNLNTKVEASNIKGLQIDATKSNARANIQPNKSALSSIGQQCTTVKAGITAALRQAQGEVVAAAKSVGADPGELYPNTDMAPGSGAELVIQSVGVKSTGMGSLAVKASNSLTNIGDVVADRRKKPNKEAEAAIEQELRAKSSAPQEDTRAAFKAAMSADAAPEEMEQSKMDWNAFFDDGHELKDLMSIDPDNPSPDLVPEFAEVEQIERNVMEAETTVVYAEQATSYQDGPQGIDTKDIDPEAFKAQVAMTGQSFSGFSGLPKGALAHPNMGTDVKEQLREANRAALVARAPQAAQDIFERQFNQQPVMG